MVVVALVIALAAGGAYVYYATPSPSSTGDNARDKRYDGPLGAYAKLDAENPDYKRAGDLLRASDFQGALTALNAALSGASDPERRQIQFDIANAVNLSGDPVRATQMYLAIAADTTETPIMRAYAIQYIGRMYRARGDARITTEVFGHPTFAALRADGDDALSYRQLYEYGAALFPLALTDLYIAQAHALATATAADKESHLAIVKAKLASADADLARMAISTSNEIKTIPEALLVKALVLEALQPHDAAIKNEAVENAYKQALNMYATLSQINGNDFYMRISYAAYLARAEGESRAAEIATILQPTYRVLENPASAHAAYLKTGRDAPARYEGLVALGLVDEDFKDALITLGWYEKDFTAAQ